MLHQPQRPLLFNHHHQLATETSSSSQLPPFPRTIPVNISSPFTASITNAAMLTSSHRNDYNMDATAAAAARSTDQELLTPTSSLDEITDGAESTSTVTKAKNKFKKTRKNKNSKCNNKKVPVWDRLLHWPTLDRLRCCVSSPSAIVGNGQRRPSRSPSPLPPRTKRTTHTTQNTLSSTVAALEVPAPAAPPTPTTPTNSITELTSPQDSIPIKIDTPPLFASNANKEVSAFSENTTAAVEEKFFDQTEVIASSLAMSTDPSATIAAAQETRTPPLVPRSVVSVSTMAATKPLPPRPPGMKGRAVSINSLSGNNPAASGLSPRLPLSRKLSSALTTSSSSSANMVKSSMARAISTATNGSQHKRNQASFCFSVTSLQEIHKSDEEIATAELTSSSKIPSPSESLNSWATAPVANIECSALTRDCSELLFEEEEEALYGVKHNPSTDEVDDLLISADEEEEEEDTNIGKVDNNDKNEIMTTPKRRSSPTSVSTPPEWMLAWANSEVLESALEAEMIMTADVFDRTTKSVVTDPCSDITCAVETPVVYLPYSSEKSLGWMAVSCNDELLSRQGVLNRRSIAQVQVVQRDDTAENGRVCLSIANDLEKETMIDLKDCYVSTTFCCPEWGRAVVLRDCRQQAVQCIFLPVSLPPAFFTENDEQQQQRLVSEDVFAKLAPAMITPFMASSSTNILRTDSIKIDNGFHYDDNSTVSSLTMDQRQYAPETQQDAVMNLLFRLDTLIRYASLPPV